MVESFQVMLNHFKLCWVTSQWTRVRLDHFSYGWIISKRNESLQHTLVHFCYHVQSIYNWLNHFAIHRSAITSLLVQSILVSMNQFTIGWTISLYAVQSFLFVMNRFFLVSINRNREVELAVFKTNQSSVGWIISQ